MGAIPCWLQLAGRLRRVGWEEAVACCPGNIMLKLGSAPCPAAASAAESFVAEVGPCSVLPLQLSILLLTLGPAPCPSADTAAKRFVAEALLHLPGDVMNRILHIFHRENESSTATPPLPTTTWGKSIRERDKERLGGHVELKARNSVIIFLLIFLYMYFFLIRRIN